MIVAQIVESDAPGGTERLVIQLAQELLKRDHRVVAVGPAAGCGWLGGELRAQGVPWEPVPRRFMLDPRAVQDLIRVFRRHRVEAVHSHEFAPSVFGAAASWVTGRRHVITMHSNPYFGTAWRRRVAFGWAVRHSATVAVSGDTGAEAERVLRLPPGSIATIPNGIAARPGHRDGVRRELGLGADELLVVALGNVSPRKAHILLLHALIAVRQRRPELTWHLAIAGTDQGSAGELRQVAAEHGLSGRVRLLGHRADTEDLLAAADVFAMSSLHEGMPLAIMEAMLAGKAVVSTRAGGIGEMIADGVDGLLTPVADPGALAEALERLLESETLRDRLGRAAAERAARQFGIGRMVDSYLTLYRGNGR